MKSTEWPAASFRLAALDRTGLDARRHSAKDLDAKVAQVAFTFEEDRQVIEAQYERRMEEPDRPLLGIRVDGPSVMARRIISELVAKEQTAPARTVAPV